MTMTDQGEPSGGSRPTGREDGASVREMASAAAQTVKAETATFAAAAQDKVADKVSEHAAAATHTMGDFAIAIRKAGDDLAQRDQSVAGRMVKQAADGLESFTRAVSDKRPEDLLDTVRDFGRKNPAAFIAGSILIGMALGRVAKSSEQRLSPSEPEFRRPSDYLGSTAAAVPAGDPSRGETGPEDLPPYGTPLGSRA